MKLGISDYKNVRYSSNIIALYFNRLLLQVAFSVVGIFLVIFFYTELNNSIIATIAVFVAIYIGHGLLTPLGAKFMEPLGIKLSMMIAVPFAFLATFSLFFWSGNPIFVLMLYIFFVVIYKVFYWIPYHIDFAKFTNRKTRGRQMAVLNSITQLVLLASPFLGGVIISIFGYDSLFLISASIFLLALIPLFFVQPTHEKFSFGYFETFQKLFLKKHRSLLLAYTGDGAQAVVTAVIWPIFIFTLLDGDFFIVGVISTVTIISLIVLRFIIGDIVDKWSRKKILTIGSILYTSGWIIKIFIETALQIFIIDTYHKAGSVINRTSFDTTSYDQASDNGHYIDEFTVLKEVSLNAGRVGMLIIIGILITLFGIKAAFLAAAFATLFMTMLNNRIEVE